MRFSARTGAVAVVALVLLAPGAAATPATGSATALTAPAVTAPAVTDVRAAVPAATSAARPALILLTPTTDPATSQVISWTMPARQSGQRVQFRLPGKKSRSVAAVRRPATKKRFSGSSAPRYAATLVGLLPGSRYEYRIRTRGYVTKWRSFTTAAAAAQPLTIIGLGDTQVDNLGVPRSTIRRALAAAPEAQLVLQAGDVVDRPTKAAQWSALFGAMGSSARTRNWIVSIGNHEQCVLVLNCDANGAEAFRSYFDWPTNGTPATPATPATPDTPEQGTPGQGDTWFFTDYQGVRIVVLDSFGGRMAEQALFLDQALASNPNRWSIVLMHAPPFATMPGRTNPEVRQLLLPIIEARGVDLVLSGHDHSYARGQREPDGPVFTVSVSGPKYYDVTHEDWAANGASRTVWAAGTSTYQVIRIDGDELQYRAVVSHRGKGSTSPFRPGGVLDQFTIVKDDVGGKVVR